MNRTLANGIRVFALCLTLTACSAGEDSGSQAHASAAAADAGFGQAVGRYFHRRTGEHFYTANPGEAFAAGFVQEAFPYFFVGTHPDQFGDAVTALYRCRLRAGKHFYTTNASCEGAPAVLEGVLGYVATTPFCGGLPLTRMFNRNNGDHFYTISAAEVQTLIMQFERTGRGYVEEGIAGYVWTDPTGPLNCGEPSGPVRGGDGPGDGNGNGDGGGVIVPGGCDPAMSICPPSPGNVPPGNVPPPSGNGGGIRTNG
jgi:hypothetical protein